MAPMRRGHRSDGEATYNRILEAAGELFAEHGFAETSNKEIAARAGVDLASINYHFDGRVGLYRAVVAEAHRRYLDLESLRQLAAADLAPRVKLRQWIEWLIGDTDSRRSWPAKVACREFLNPSSHIGGLPPIDLTQKMQIGLGIVSEITAIPPGDPALIPCLFGVLAPCAMLIVAGPGMVPGLEGSSSMQRDVLIAHLSTFCLGGLEAIGRANRERQEQIPSGALSAWTDATP